MTIKTLGKSFREPVLGSFFRNKWYAATPRAQPVLELVKLCVEDFRGADNGRLHLWYKKR